MVAPACQSFCGAVQPAQPAPVVGGDSLLGAAAVQGTQTANTGAGFVATGAEVSFTLDEAASVLVAVGGVLAKGGGGGTISSVGLSVDGAAPTAERTARTTLGGSNLPESVALVAVIALAAGAHTIRLMFSSEAGAATVCGPTSAAASGLGFSVHQL